MAIRDTVASLSLVDNHAHPVEPLSSETITEQFATYFTEGDLSPKHARHTVNYRAALRFLSEYFDGESETALLEHRAEVDLQSYSRELINTTNTETILTDDGFPDTTPKEFRSYTDAEVRPILRLETVIEQLVPEHDSFASFVDAFETHVEEALAGDYIGLKSIIAYRTGLDVSDPEPTAARDAFEQVRENWNGRIEHPIVLDYLIHRAADIAGETNAPLQFHTGFGDSDAHPRFVNPTHLFDFLRAHTDTPFVVLHAGYPYVRQAGYVTATLDNVYLDISLALPFIQHGCEPLIAQALELAPSTKILYGSDAFSVPELYVLAADRIRADLASVLEQLQADGFVDEAYAETIARNVLRENAQRLYDL